ncbi:hypothetical protein LOD99_9839 [Oopsacas minuta]|uniref:HAT C-terminal dimerisation domain-containing protein n=1 Tax=Oopsacas minuta TaxID=111878 RepID=A0AAV7KK37_9METZ|nr:hypothetical protein LOD99_9839 [Oopsacas minuta]
MIAFCADNAPVNFGGINRAAGDNVFTKLKQIKSKLIPVGCPSHLVHKSAQIAGERALSVDIESIVAKISSFFSGEKSGVLQRHQRFIEFRDFLELHYLKFPNHGKTRWLTLFPLIERILKLWEALKSYFLSNEICPRMLETFFESNLSQCYFFFMHSALKLFNTTSLILQRNNLSLPEMIRAITEMELAKIDNVIQIHKFKSECMTFYQISFDYLDKWLHLDSLPQNLDWLLLKDVDLIDYKILKGCAELLCPEIAQIDDLFEEVCCLQRNFPSLSMTSDLSLDQRWGIITQENFPCIRKLVSSIFAIPASNAVCERVFSLSKVQWSDDRNKLDISTVGALLKVIVNFEMSCREIIKN